MASARGVATGARNPPFDIDLSNRNDSPPPPPFIALIADTCPTDPPPRIDDYSSHRLLWEAIRRELRDDPFAAGDDPAAYLERRVRAFGVADEGLDRPQFVDGLILPAYAQSVARLLIGAALPLRLFGAGWRDLPEFAPHAAGPVPDRRALERVAHASAALAHPWPARHAHPIEALGRPVVRAAGSHAAALIHSARSALAGAAAAPANAPALSVEAVLRIFN